MRSIVRMALVAAFLGSMAAWASVKNEAAVIDPIETATFAVPGEKGRLETIEGKVGQALKFSFDDDCRGVFFRGQARGKPEWDKAGGFSFWVKGDGSDHLGGLEIVWNEDYSMRYGYAFPINGTQWRKIVVPWRDLIPELGKINKTIDPRSGNAPSKLGQLSFGKWWYWKDYAAHSYTIDEIRLEPNIEMDTKEYRPKGAPLERVRAKLKAGRPITVVTMGDSLTDFAHWANRDINWPTLLQTRLKEGHGSQVNIVNPAMGGTELRQNLVVLPRWTSKQPAPDLVTVFFGFNDWSSGMRGETFYAAQKDAIDRIRRATGGKADVLILTTCPALENGDTFAELAEACRKAARDKNAGLADVYSAFQAVADKAGLYVHDKVHLAAPGHELVAKTVLDAIAKGGR